MGAIRVEELHVSNHLGNQANGCSWEDTANPKCSDLEKKKKRGRERVSVLISK